MGQALYRTYRSKKLSEIVGQEHITTALNHALKQGTISHAYLFTGPRGVGKTSIARILAHEINNLPYDESQNHLDIIEIDAASNRRIDEIRDLRDKVHIAPSSATYKVYIIDEVHMLTKEAFNALLKTLEEPPAHVVFILATTEAHKLPETIISRTQRYSFKPVDHQKVVEHLKHIAKAEKITIDDQALDLIATHGEGSFRDSISLLDQVRNMKGTVSLKAVQGVLGIAPEELITDTLQALSQHDAISLTKQLKQMYEQGFEATHIARQLGGSLRKSILDNTLSISRETAMRLLTQLVQIPVSPDPRIMLEIILLDAALEGAPTAPPKPPKTAAAEAKVMPEEVPLATKPAIQVDTKEKIAAAVVPKDIPSEELQSIDSDIVLTDKAWDIILNALKQKHNTLYSIVKIAQPHFEPGKMTLEFAFAFHQKRINEVRNKQTLTEIISGVTGSEVQIECILGTGKAAPPPAPLPPADGETVHSVSAPNPKETVTAPPSSDQDIDAISNIFGGAELLES